MIPVPVLYSSGNLNQFVAKKPRNENISDSTALLCRRTTVDGALAAAQTKGIGREYLI